MLLLHSEVPLCGKRGTCPSPSPPLDVDVIDCTTSISSSDSAPSRLVMPARSKTAAMMDFDSAGGGGGRSLLDGRSDVDVDMWRREEDDEDEDEIWLGVASRIEDQVVARMEKQRAMTTLKRMPYVLARAAATVGVKAEATMMIWQMSGGTKLIKIDSMKKRRCRQRGASTARPCRPCRATFRLQRYARRSINPGWLRKRRQQWMETKKKAPTKHAPEA